MENPKNLKIVEVCNVSPAPADSACNSTPKSLNLTFFDLKWLPVSPVRRLYLYDLSTRKYSNTTPSFFDSNILPRLKQSLSLTLRHFLPLAGNLVWPQYSPLKPVLSYAQGDAVCLTVAESEADFFRLSRSSGYGVFEPTEAYRPLLPVLASSHERASPLALQVTLFPNVGFSIGLTTHHAVFDGKSATSFVKAWAHICRKLGDHCQSEVHQSPPSDYSLPPDLKPFFGRDSISERVSRIESIFAKIWTKYTQNQPNPNSLLILPPNGKEVTTDSVRATFRLTSEDIQKLRQSVQGHASTFSLTYGYTLTCLIKAEGLSEVGGEVLVFFPADVRSRLDPPIPATYFGNCLSNNSLTMATKDLAGEDGLALAVKAIGDAVTSMVTDGVLEREERWLMKRMATSPVEAKRVYSVGGSPRFEVYGTDFGWGRPRMVDMASVDSVGDISLYEDRNGDGGIEIGLVLKRLHMEAFASLFAQGLGDQTL